MRYSNYTYNITSDSNTCAVAFLMEFVIKVHTCVFLGKKQENIHVDSLNSVPRPHCMIGITLIKPSKHARLHLVCKFSILGLIFLCLFIYLFFFLSYFFFLSQEGRGKCGTKCYYCEVSGAFTSFPGESPGATHTCPHLNCDFI